MKAAFHLSTSAFLWGLNFHLLKVMLDYTGFLEAGFYRYFFAVISLLLISFKYRSSLKLPNSKISSLLITGIFGIFLFNILLFRGLKYTSSLNASIIISLSPVLTLFLSYLLLKDSIKLLQIFGAMVSIFGIVYLLTKGAIAEIGLLNISTGDSLIFAAAILVALYHIWVKKWSYGINNQTFTFFTNLICLICFILMIPLMPKLNPLQLPLAFWMAAIAFGCLGTAITYILWNKGVQMIGADKAGLYMNLVPVSTAFFTILSGEKVEQYHVIAGVFVLTGLFLANFKIDVFRSSAISGK